MGDKSEIQWTDATWNPVTGCSHVSDGCDHCYAETLTQRYAKSWGVPGLPWTPENADVNVILKPHKLEEPLRWRKPRMIFVNSMSDLFHPKVPTSYVLKVFDVMDRAPRHIFQVLTKRPKRQRDFCRKLRRCRDCQSLKLEGGCSQCGASADADPLGLPLPNVWLGTSIENRDWVSRADLLRETPAAVRFISAEPLLGPLIFDDVDRVGFEGGPGAAGPKWADDSDAGSLELQGIDWLIVGGESGPDHRPVEEAWILALREACLAENLSRDPNGCANAGPHFFFKQWGGRTPKAGGRLLEGREWNEMPAVAPAEEVSPV